MVYVLRYIIEEFDYQTAEWLPKECTMDIQLAVERLQWHLVNNDIANHRITIVTQIPAQPWD